MTRWKREPVCTLIMMHAHNQWSRYYDCILAACTQLELPVAVRVSANHYDRSRDTEWYTSAAALEKVGGIRTVTGLARKIQFGEDNVSTGRA